MKASDVVKEKGTGKKCRRPTWLTSIFCQGWPALPQGTPNCLLAFPCQRTQWHRGYKQEEAGKGSRASRVQLLVWLQQPSLLHHASFLFSGKISTSDFLQIGYPVILLAGRQAFLHPKNNTKLISHLFHTFLFSYLLFHLILLMSSCDSQVEIIGIK